MTTVDGPRYRWSPLKARRLAARWCRRVRAKRRRYERVVCDDSRCFYRWQHTEPIRGRRAHHIAKIYGAPTVVYADESGTLRREPGPGRIEVGTVCREPGAD